MDFNNIKDISNMYDIKIDTLNISILDKDEEDNTNIILYKTDKNDLIIKGYIDKDNNCCTILYNKNHESIFTKTFILFDNKIIPNIDGISGSDISKNDCINISTNICLNLINKYIIPELIKLNCKDIYNSSVIYKKQYELQNIKNHDTKIDQFIQK